MRHHLQSHPASGRPTCGTCKGKLSRSRYITRATLNFLHYTPPAAAGMSIRKGPVAMRPDQPLLRRQLVDSRSSRAAELTCSMAMSSRRLAASSTVCRSTAPGGEEADSGTPPGPPVEATSANWQPRPSSNQQQPQQPAAAADPQAAAAAAAAVDKADIKENMDKAAKLIDDILEEVMRELFAEQATAYISEEAGSPMTEEEAVRNAVVARIEFLDANFLAALNGYVQAVTRQGGGMEDLLPLLELMRNEVLYQVALRLPPAARVLNRVLQDVDKDARVRVLRTSLGGGLADLPGSDADSLVTASSQFIDDMEDQDTIVDRRLLARLCLVREELRWLGLETSFTELSPAEQAAAGGEEGGDQEEGDAGSSGRAAGAPGSSSSATSATSFYRSNVPQRSAAFIKQLVVVKDSTQRVALISRAFCEDWEGAAPRQKPQRGQPDKGQPDFVRPGRFMSTLSAMVMQMEADGSVADLNQQGLLRRMGDIQLEAITVLDRMQRGELAKA